MNPLDILDRAIILGVYNRYKNVPGAVISRLGTEAREILSKLKSDDMRHVRDEQVFDQKFDEKKKMSNMLKEFDKKMRK